MPDQADLSPAFAPPPQGLGEPMLYLQGEVLAWNPTTLANTVDVAGTTFTDLPVLGVAEAASITAGSTVGIQVVGSTFAIIGRFVRPGTDEATDAITVLSQQIYTNTVEDIGTTSSTSFTDLSTAGPSVDVTIRASGRALVLLSGMLGSSASDNTLMGFAVSGASTVAAADVESLSIGGNSSDAGTIGLTLLVGRAIEVNGLNPGVNTFTAKYRKGSGGGTASFAYRNITVFAL